MNLEHGKYGVCAIRWNLDWFVNNEYYRPRIAISGG